MSRPPVQVPIRNSDGQIVWVNKYHSRRTLGDTTETLSTVQSGLKLASTAQDASGAQPTNKTLNDISKVSAAIAGTVGVVIPIVGIVAGIVSVAAKILSGVFGGGPTSEQQLRTLNNTNDDLRDQINTIDSQIAKVNDGLKAMYSALQANGFNTSQLNGLGDIFSDMQEVQLQTAANASLQKILVQKGQQLQSLLQTYTSVVQQVNDAITTKSSGRQIFLWILLGLATLGLGVYAVRELEHKEE
jgi:hypothetical protein